MDGLDPSLKHAWEVLTLFLIPVGGGIPAGVLLARSHGLVWPLTALLYFVSDVILALVFEPLMLGLAAIAKRVAFLRRVGSAFKEAFRRTSPVYGTHLGPLALIGVSFGVDPMTGRAAALAAGHGFVTGWLIAIAGDMIYFAVIMVSTLWLDNYLGNGTWTTLIILALMLGLPPLIRRIRLLRKRAAPAR
jgi:hypothetical protein